jgi:hypothetical protein
MRVKALLPASQYGSHQSRAAATVHDGDNPQWPLIRRIGYEIIPRCGETQGTLGQIGAAMALMGKRDKRFDSRLDGVYDPVSGLKTVFRYEFPNSVKVGFGLGVKPIAAH